MDVVLSRESVTVIRTFDVAGAPTIPKPYTRTIVILPEKLTVEWHNGNAARVSLQGRRVLSGDRLSEVCPVVKFSVRYERHEMPEWVLPFLDLGGTS
jgi:hypothetical protein